MKQKHNKLTLPHHPVDVIRNTYIHARGSLPKLMERSGMTTFYHSFAKIPLPYSTIGHEDDDEEEEDDDDQHYDDSDDEIVIISDLIA